MPWILQMLGFGLMLVGIAVALWVSVWVLLFFFALAMMGVVWAHLKDYLIAKGILNPKAFAAPTADAENVTIVEGNYQRIETTEVISKE